MPARSLRFSPAPQVGLALRSQDSFDAVKYASGTSPVLLVSRAHTSVQKRLDLWLALAALPDVAGDAAVLVSRSQTTRVSRWLTMPMPAFSLPINPACWRALRALSSVVVQISAAS